MTTWFTNSRGCVASSDPRTAEAGAEALRRGGNAVDAIVAAAFACSVVEFSLTGIGGGGIATVRVPGAGDDGDAQEVVYDFFSTMPGMGRNPDKHFHRDRLDFREVDVDFGTVVQRVWCGRASTAVPGVVAGLGRLHAAHGRLPWRELVAPAIELAEKPLFLSPIMAEVTEMIAPILLLSEESRRVLSPRGKFVRDPEGVRQSDLARTLAKIAAEGPDAFYRGEIAEKIVADSDANGGLITEEDLARYEVLELEPRRVAYRDRVVILPRGPSWGGRLIALTLALLNHRPVGESEYRSLDYVMTIAEAMRLTQQRRAEHHDDLDALCDDELIDEARELLDARIADRSRRVRHAPPDHHGPPNTSHISAIDADGMAVALTSSTGFCSGMLYPGTGIIANNMLGEPDLNPRGFHALKPGARMSTMMSPCIVERDNEVDLVLGSAGANRLRSAIVQTIVHHVDYGFGVSEAVNLPRVHFETDELHIEASDEPALVAALEECGYDVKAWTRKSLFFGGCNTVARRPVSSDDGESIAGFALTGAGDRRREGGSVTV